MDKASKASKLSPFLVTLSHPFHRSITVDIFKSIESFYRLIMSQFFFSSASDSIILADTYRPIAIVIPYSMSDWIVGCRSPSCENILKCNKEHKRYFALRNVCRREVMEEQMCCYLITRMSLWFFLQP